VASLLIVHLLHKQHALLIKGALLFKPNVIVTSVPFHLGHNGSLKADVGGRPGQWTGRFSRTRPGGIGKSSVISSVIEVEKSANAGKRTKAPAKIAEMLRSLGEWSGRNGLSDIFE
jgi:hypothetical protein